MQVTEAPARDARPLIAEIHADLLALLASLRDTEWAAPTEAGPLRPPLWRRLPDDADPALPEVDQRHRGPRCSIQGWRP